MYKDKTVLAIVLARTNSGRLKNKMLLPFLDYETVLESVLDRISKCKLIDKVVLATTDYKNDT